MYFLFFFILATALMLSGYLRFCQEVVEEDTGGQPECFHRGEEIPRT